MRIHVEQCISTNLVISKMSLFQEKYRSESHRLANWDYSQEGIYFITVCSNNQVCLFGDIINEKMVLNELGIIIEEEISNSIILRSKWIFHNWVIMPNHLHFLIEIVEAQNEASTKQKLQRKPKSISSFVGIFKTVVTKRINELQGTTQKIWQNNYHDHIVRNYDSFEKISNYIVNNPINWNNDVFYS